jgi:hypothetical protein
LGKNSSLEVHHIFPKKQLYDAPQKYTRGEVNVVANFALLTKDSNLLISDEDPDTYLAKIAEKFPGALESQWIPMDPMLWKIANYRDFIEARKVLLANSANALLTDLNHGPLPAHIHVQAQLAAAKGGILDEEEARKLEELNDWIEAQRLPRGVISYELADPMDGSIRAILDLAWPEGLQRGLSRPVAVLLNEPNDLILEVQKQDYLVFASIASFRSHVRDEVLAGVGAN